MDVTEQARVGTGVRSTFSPWLNKLALIISDGLAFALAFLVTYWVLGLSGSDKFTVLGSMEAGVGLARVGCFFLLVLAGIGWCWTHLRHYTYRKPFWSELREVLQLVVGLAVADLALVALSKWDFSRLQWALLWSMVLLLLPLFRATAKLMLRRAGVWQWPSFIIGCGDNAREAYQALQGERMMGFEVQAFVAPNDQCQGSPVEGIPLLPDDMQRLISANPEAKFFLAMEYEQAELRDNWLRLLTAQGSRNVSVIPTLRGVPLHGTDMSHLLSHELLMLRVRNNLARASARAIKRTFDVVVSSLLLLLLSPVLAYIGWKVSRDGGSPIYGHERVGQGGRTFRCLKFRSMIVNSQAVLQTLLATDAQARAEWERDFKLKDDPRITPIGHFIRQTSLDELPQLWNVLKGEMSLVGPRPVVQPELERYGEDKEYYLMAKPGMTGLWQVSGRNDVDYATRVYLDGWFVKNWSLWYDIAILFKTVGVVLRQDGAY